ncbi:hypothetical protein [Lysinibacillus sp. NPDC086135]|uniref:hypothetical protein n=1 Tax=Lysinibacillus sp. NPDC086135 TaxID=3364130 RepID=UPI00380CE26B
MKFNGLWIVILCFAFLLSACGKENDEKVSINSEPKVDLSTYPIGVQEGKISLEYYAILDETMTEYFDMDKSLKNLGNSDVETKKELYRKYLLYLNGVNYSTSNNVEKEIDNYFSSFLYNTKQWAEYRIKNLDTKSNLDSSVASDYFTDAKNDMLMVIDIMGKYKLFHEK